MSPSHRRCIQQMERSCIAGLHVMNMQMTHGSIKQPLARGTGMDPAVAPLAKFNVCAHV